MSAYRQPSHGVVRRMTGILLFGVALLTSAGLEAGDPPSENALYGFVHVAGAPGAQASNPAQGYRADFSSGQVSVAPLVDVVGTTPAWVMRLEVTRVGRVGQLRAVSQPAAELGRGRLEYRRAGVTEWYINEARGLEQGFDVHRRPSGEGAVVIELRFSGSLVPRRVDESSVSLSAGTGEEVLRYTGLRAWDSAGVGLDARMEVDRGGIVRLVVDDRGADYPITIDPWLESAEVRASDDTSNFGHSAALNGDVAVVGTVQGAAYVFEPGTDSGSDWAQVHTFSPPYGESGGYFGHSVSVSCDVAVVGAWGANAAYVFERNRGGPNNWGHMATLRPPDGAGRINFGVAVSASSQWIVVGAPRHDARGEYAGAAFVFERNRGGVGNWGQVARLLANDGARGDEFGRAVAAFGSTVIIGAPENDDRGTDAGAAYIFSRTDGEDGTWREIEKLHASNGVEEDGFGSAVSLGKNVAVVGAQGADGDEPDSGAAYVFSRQPDRDGAFREDAHLTASDATKEGHFGAAVAVSGQTVVIGSPDDDVGYEASGSAYVFELESGVWTQTDQIVASDGSQGDKFGKQVGVSGDTILVGSVGSHSAYLFTLADTPSAFRDEAETPADTAVDIDVLGNDAGLDAGQAVLTVELPPAHGSVRINSDNTMTYTPSAGYVGADHFAYRIHASDGGSDVAHVSLFVGDASEYEDQPPPPTGDGGCTTSGGSGGMPSGVLLGWLALVLLHGRGSRRWALSKFSLRLF